VSNPSKSQVIPLEGGKFARPRTMTYADRRRLALHRLGFTHKRLSAGPKPQLDESRCFHGEGRFLTTRGAGLPSVGVAPVRWVPD
jgi:hypothetical protein